VPSFSSTTATLTVTPGSATISPRLFSATAAAAVLRGGAVSFSIGQSLGTAETVPSLNRLQRSIPYYNKDGTPTAKAQIDYQRNCEATEAAFAGINNRVDDLAALLAQIQAAMDIATGAATKATEVDDLLTVALGFVDPVNVLSATSDGTITIEAHTRVYGDGTSVAVDAGTVTGFAPGDYVSVIYQDAARAGGAVSYSGTTSAVVQTGSRHVVGQVTIPALGSPASMGAGTVAPGYVPPENIAFDIQYTFF